MQRGGKTTSTKYNGPGIYQILNKYTGDWYIGSSKHVSTRIHQHFSLLRNGKHPNKKMQREFDKYNEFFVCFLLEKIPDATTEQLRDAESKAIREELGKGGTYNASPVNSHEWSRFEAQQLNKTIADGGKEILKRYEIK